MVKTGHFILCDFYHNKEYLLKLSGIPDRAQATFSNSEPTAVPTPHMLFLVSHSPLLPRKLLPHAACRTNSELASPNHSLYRPHLTKNSRVNATDMRHNTLHLKPRKGHQQQFQLLRKGHPLPPLQHSCLTQVRPVGDKWTKAVSPRASWSRCAWMVSEEPATSQAFTGRADWSSKMRSASRAIAEHTAKMMLGPWKTVEVFSLRHTRTLHFQATLHTAKTT